MRPGDNIYFFILGNFGLVVFIICLFIFRKRLKVAFSIGAIMLVVLIGYYVYFPTIKENEHAKDYETLKSYLQQNYPNENYIIKPETLEEGSFVGEFYVSNAEIPERGFIIHVNKDKVEQFGWFAPSYTLSKDTLWQQFYEYQNATLDTPLRKVTPVDRVEHGNLVIVAVLIEGTPAIGAFDYSNGAVSTIEMKEGSPGQPITIQADEKQFVFYPENFSAVLPDGATKGSIYTQ